jgi:hypothetical protein
MGLADEARDILAPFIGHTVADTCVRATALSVGKSYDTLSHEDVPALVANIRRLLAPVAPAATVESIVKELEGKAADARS